MMAIDADTVGLVGLVLKAALADSCLAKPLNVPKSLFTKQAIVKVGR